jgi:hypothetical protein
MNKTKKWLNKEIEKPILMEYTRELIEAQINEKEPKPIPEGITIEELEKYAISNHMVYNIMGSLIKLPIEDEVKARFREYLKKSTLKTLQQVCAAKQISEAFEKAGIRSQVLKGTIMKDIYPRPEMREMGDIDFMVYESSFDKAEEILTQMGYEKLRAIKHHVIFRKAPYLVVEVHWSLYEQTVDKEQYMYYKDNFRARLKEGTQYTYEFSDEDFYVYMISHMAKHFYENGCGIRNLMDVYIYRGQYESRLDWKYVACELEKCGLVDFEYHVSRLADMWLGGKESTEFYNQLFMYMIDCGIYGKSENGIWGQLVKQDAYANNNGKIGYYFPSLNYMQEYYPWLNKHSFLLPVAWIIRGAKGMSSSEARNRAKMLDDNQTFQVTKNIYQQLNLNFTK